MERRQEPTDAVVEDKPVRWGLGDFALGWVGAYAAVLVCSPIVLALTGQAGVDQDRWPLSTIALNQVPFYGVMLGTALIVTRVKGRGPAADLGLRARWADVPLGAAAGLGCQLVASILYWPLYWWTSVTVQDVEGPARELSDRAHGTGGVILLVVVAVIAAAVVEEIFFRGLLLSGLRRRIGDPGALILSSAVFAGTHFQWLQFTALFAFGLAAGGLALRTGRLGPSILAHLAFNATAVFFLLR